MPRALVVLLSLAATVVVVAGLKAVAWLVTPVLLAVVIVIAVSPAHRWLRARGLPSWLATGVLVTLVYGTLLGFTLVLLASVARLVELLPQYAERAESLLAEVTAALARAGVEPEDVRRVAASVDVGSALSWLGSLLRQVTGLTTSLVFLLALLLFLSVEAAGADRRLAALAEAGPTAGAALLEFARRTRRYVLVTTAFGAGIAVLDTLALAALGIPLAVLWGLLSFVTNYVPTIGFLAGLLPPAVLALLEGGWSLLLLVVLVYWAINFVAQSLIQPRFVGEAVGLSAVITFLALVFWSWVLGPAGALLAVPATLLVTTTLIDPDPRAAWASALVRSATTPRRSGRRRR